MGGILRFIIMFPSIEYIEFSEIVVEELINRGTYTLTHHAMIGSDNVTSKRLKGTQG